MHLHCGRTGSPWSLKGRVMVHGVNENTPLQRLGLNNASGTAFSSLLAQQPPKNSSSTFPDRYRVTSDLFSVDLRYRIVRNREGAWGREQDD